MKIRVSSYFGYMSTMSHHPHNQGHIQSHQRPIQQDWANREYIEVITGSIKKISDFLNSFGKYQSIEKMWNHAMGVGFLV